MATIWPAGVWLFSKVGFCRVALFPHGTARMFSDRRRLSGKIFRDKRFLGCFRVELRVHRELGTHAVICARKGLLKTTAQLISIASV